MRNRFFSITLPILVTCLLGCDAPTVTGILPGPFSSAPTACPDGVELDLRILDRAGGEAWDTFGKSDHAPPDPHGWVAANHRKERLALRRDTSSLEGIPFFVGQAISVEGALTITVLDKDYRQDDVVVSQEHYPFPALFRDAMLVSDNGQLAVRARCR